MLAVQALIPDPRYRVSAALARCRAASCQGLTAASVFISYNQCCTCLQEVKGLKRQLSERDAALHRAKGMLTELEAVTQQLQAQVEESQARGTVLAMRSGVQPILFVAGADRTGGRHAAAAGAGGGKPGAQRIIALIKRRC